MNPAVPAVLNRPALYLSTSTENRTCQTEVQLTLLTIARALLPQASSPGMSAALGGVCNVHLVRTPAQRQRAGAVKCLLGTALHPSCRAGCRQIFASRSTRRARMALSTSAQAAAAVAAPPSPAAGLEVRSIALSRIRTQCSIGVNTNCRQRVL